MYTRVRLLSTGKVDNGKKFVAISSKSRSVCVLRDERVGGYSAAI
jgi:hypothetical protein